MPLRMYQTKLVVLPLVPQITCQQHQAPQQQGGVPLRMCHSQLVTPPPMLVLAHQQHQQMLQHHPQAHLTAV